MEGRTTFDDSQISTHSLLSPDFVLSQKYGIGPDFQVHTGIIKAFSQPDQPDRPLVRMCGSSTIFDLQNDCMMLSALQDMQKAEPGMTIWLNHSYRVPQDCFGKLFESPTIQMSQSIADLWLTAEAVLDNPDAAQTYNMIARDGVKFGCSIGCMVLDWSFADPDDEWNSPILIHHVDVLEWSLVGLPAVQRCWVENSIKGLFARALVDGKAEDALRLAPAYKGLFQREYGNVIQKVTSKGLRQDLSKIAMRNARPHRIVYDFQQESFQLTDGRQMNKSLSREATADIFRFQDAAGSVAQAAATREEGLEEPEGEHGWTVWQKAVTGKTSWPLATLATEWTGSEAEQDIFAYAGGDDFSPAKAKQGFLYQDADEDPKTRKAYKMPFCYASDNGLKIVPLGVRSAANVLAGGMGGISASDEDKAGMKAKVKTMIGRINRELKPDPEWGIPWEKDEGKSVEEDAVSKKKIELGQKEIADSNNADALNRQDLGEVPAGTGEKQSDDPTTVKAAADVSVSEDGTHEACTGSHTHQHKAMGDQGGDENHSHSHTHKGDASHGHDHEEKSGEGTIDKQASMTDGGSEPAPETVQSETPAPSGEEETTPAAVPASSDEEVSPTETTAVPGGSNENEVEAILRALDEEAPVLEAKVTIWNDLAKSMGLPEYSWNAVKDYLARSRSGEAVDANLLWDTSELTVKEGRAISAKTKGVLQGIHDACMSLHPGVCSNAPQGQDDDDGDNDNEENTNDTKSIQGEVLTNNLLLSVDQDSVKQAVEGVVTEHMKGLTSMIQQAFTGMMDQMVSNLSVLHEKQKGVEAGIVKAKGEMMALTEQTARLSRMPMGRPTQLTRSVDATGAATGYAATYQEMVNAGQQNMAPTQARKLADLEGFTQFVERPMPRRDGAASTMQYRHWPAGVGAPVGAEEGVARPALTPQQSIYMLPAEWEAYNNGEAASVPHIDDPFSV